MDEGDGLQGDPDRLGGKGVAEDEDAADDLGGVGDQAHQPDRLDRAAALQGGDGRVLGERAAGDGDRDQGRGSGPGCRRHR